MPVSNWWTVRDSTMTVTGGPFMWDGESPWQMEPGEKAVNQEPTTLGYSWPGTTPDPMVNINARLGALEQRIVREAHGVKSWPAVGLMALGATNTQRVKLNYPLPNTNYDASALLVGGALLGSLSISAVTIVDNQNVDVTIKAGVLVTVTLGSVSALVFGDAR